MTDHPEPDRLWEYIEALQKQVDRLIDLDEKRMDRIRRLERDRATLRRQLSGKTRVRWPRGGSVSADAGQGHAQDSEDEQGLVVPGVGTIIAQTLDPGRPARTLRVGTVLDEFSRAGFGPEFISVPLEAYSWRETVEESSEFDLLLVESAYSGPGRSWPTRIARFGEPSPLLEELVSWFRGRGIPTVFWCKEDPINFDWFIASAALFDFVFTVDGDTIPKYRSILGHDRVHLLRFFAQPTIHYPGPWEARTGDVAFAGSYYAAKHAERREQMEMLLGPALEFGLQIFDRHAGTDNRFTWPEKYRSHIVGSLSYGQTLEAYRRYKVFLNVNTITESPTMCSRRVFELAASGAPIVTTRSRAIREMLPSDAVVMVSSGSETTKALKELLADEDRLKAMAESARKWVLGAHTAQHRVDELLDAVGLSG